MSIESENIKSALRECEDEYHYRDDACDIGANRIREQTVKVDHFVVRRGERNQGIASTLLNCLEEVLKEDDVGLLKIEMGATNCYSLEELEQKREEEGQEWHDDTYEFLKNRGFENLEYIGTYQWGLCVRGIKRIR